MATLRVNKRVQRLAKVRYGRTQKRTESLLKRLTFMRKLAKHPWIKPWMPVLVAAGEVSWPFIVAIPFSFLAATFLVIALPHINWPFHVQIPHLGIPEFIATP